jgi:hypothetical protein
MKRYGKLNDIHEGDILANCMNGAKTSAVGTGHNSLRSSKQKRRIRTSMNKRTRMSLKQDLNKQINAI